MSDVVPTSLGKITNIDEARLSTAYARLTRLTRAQHFLWCITACGDPRHGRCGHCSVKESQLCKRGEHWPILEILSLRLS